MRKLASLVAGAATIALLGSAGAYAQTTSTPSKAEGAGAACSRMTDATAREACVKQAQQKGGQMKSDAKTKASSAKKAGGKAAKAAKDKATDTTKDATKANGM